ncbi:MAG TPA: SRPBCC domain-containing protein [Solirubrobacteraceae bacterium]
MIAASTLRMERTFRAPAQRVFDAWCRAEVIRRWWQAELGWETSAAEVDLRVGGVVRVVMRDPDKDVEHGGGGRYTEIEPPRRLAFTWNWDGDGRGTLIEIDFEENDGVTTVRFTHSGLSDEEAVRSHEYGWGNILDSLGRTLQAAGPHRYRLPRPATRAGGDHRRSADGERQGRVCRGVQPAL